VATELFYADGRAVRQRDMTKLIVALGHFENAPKNPSERAVYGNSLMSIKNQRENVVKTMRSKRIRNISARPVGIYNYHYASKR
jgi:hypothetical protein